MARVTNISILTASLLAVLLLLPPRAQLAVGVLVLAAGLWALHNPGEQAAVPVSSRFGDAKDAVRRLEPLDAFDRHSRAEIESALDACVREYALVLTGGGAQHLDAHLEWRGLVYERMSHAAVCGASDAVALAEESVANLFASFDRVLHAGGFAPVAPGWAATAYPSTCGRTQGR